MTHLDALLARVTALRAAIDAAPAVVGKSQALLRLRDVLQEAAREAGMEAQRVLYDAFDYGPRGKG